MGASKTLTLPVSKRTAQFPWPTSRIDSSAKAILLGGLWREPEIAENQLLGVGLAEADVG